MTTTPVVLDAGAAQEAFLLQRLRLGGLCERHVERRHAQLVCAPRRSHKAPFA